MLQLHKLSIVSIILKLTITNFSTGFEPANIKLTIKMVYLPTSVVSSLLICHLITDSYHRIFILQYFQYAEFHLCSYEGNFYWSTLTSLCPSLHHTVVIWGHLLGDLQWW